jgi:hypothetical protein
MVGGAYRTCNYISTCLVGSNLGNLRAYNNAETLSEMVLNTLQLNTTISWNSIDLRMQDVVKMTRNTLN